MSTEGIKKKPPWFLPPDIALVKQHYTEHENIEDEPEKLLKLTWEKALR
jgi:hypothetical protein